MKLDRNNLRLYAITDRSWLNGDTLAHQVELAILGGVTMIQLREKNLKGEELEILARQVQEVCRKYQIPFIINDNVDLAKKIDADGVHVGQSDMAVEQARENFAASPFEQWCAARRNIADKVKRIIRFTLSFFLCSSQRRQRF